jgi:hypothetical protein
MTGWPQRNAFPAAYPDTRARVPLVAIMLE